MHLVIPFRIITGADPADSAAVAWANIGILWRKLVTSFAVRLFGIEAPSSIDVHFRRYGFQMGRIAAASCAASMVELKAARNRPNQQLVADPVDVCIFPGNNNDSIETVFGFGISATQATTPKPAAGIRFWVNLFLQALRQRRQSVCHVLAPVWSKGCAGVNLLGAT
jgi:hypothetical protein